MKEKITIGIVTIDDYSNYGNRLQNYALTKLLEAEGFRVINGIRVNTKQDYVICSPGIIKMLAKILVPYRLVKDRITPKPVKRSGLLEQREAGFVEFTNRYTSVLPPVVAPNHRKAMQIFNQYGIDCFVAGSDQIWNPNFAGNAYNFLAFAPKNKRLSFAASIGVENIPAEKEKKYRKYIKNMKYLSVREQRAVEIIKELTGRDADLTLDPTLLLESEKWKEAVRKPDIQLDSAYICTYFLGEVPEAVACFAREKGLKIYTLNNENASELFVLDPSEFLYMIKNAAYILTDSFHAVAFAIKFHKEFYVFDRKEEGMANMFSRIETITNRFHLGNRIQSRDAVVEQPPVEHWEAIDRELLMEKKRSIERLKFAMEIS